MSTPPSSPPSLTSFLPVNAATVSVSDALVDILLSEGIDTFFGIPGGAISPLYDVLGRRSEARLVIARHETSACFMAAGYARASGRLPAVLMTSGPGITNALTGLASAHADGIPLLALGGEVARANFGRGALQEGSRYQLDVLSMARSATKAAVEITSAHGASSQLRRAIATARSGRQGPVFVSLPIDLAREQARVPRSSVHVATGFVLEDALLDEARSRLAAARQGLILAGSGARGAKAELRRLAEALDVPVATTPKAKGVFPEDHPLALGVFGYGGHESARGYMSSGPDVVLAVGCGLGETSTNNWSKEFGARECFIQIDIDAAQIGRNYPVDLALVGHARDVLGRLLTGLPTRLARVHTPTWPTVREPDAAAVDTFPLRTPRALARLQALAPPGTLYTSDIGEHLLFAIHYLRLRRDEDFMAAIGLGSMGSGIGAAIGAKVAEPARPVVSIAGDYGFQMFGLGELSTSVQHGIGVVFAVINDSAMRMVDAGFAAIYGRSPEAFQGPTVDFARAAEALGARGLRIETGADFDQLPADLFTRTQPTLLDIVVDPTQRFGANLRVEALSNFSVPPSGR